MNKKPPNYILYKNAIEGINQRFDQTIADLTKKYPLAEKLTWETKRVEAEKVLNGQQSPYLENLVVKRLEAEAIDVESVDLQQEIHKFAEKIVKKAKEYATKYAELEAEKEKKIKEIKKQIGN